MCADIEKKQRLMTNPSMLLIIHFKPIEAQYDLFWLQTKDVSDNKYMHPETLTVL